MNAIADAASLTAAPLWQRARAMFARAAAAVGDAATIAACRSLSRDFRRRIIAWLCPLEHIVRKLLLAEAAALNQAERARAASGPRLEHVPLSGMARTWQRGSAPPPAALRAGTHAIVVMAQGARPEAARSNLETSRPETWRAQFSLSLPRDAVQVANAHAPRIRSLAATSDRRPVIAGRCEATNPEPAGKHSSSRTDVDDETTPFRLARRLEALRRVLENPRPYAERLARLLARAMRRFPEIVRRYFFSGARTGDYDPEDPRLSIDALSAAYPASHTFGDSS